MSESKPKTPRMRALEVRLDSISGTRVTVKVKSKTDYASLSDQLETKFGAPGTAGGTARVLFVCDPDSGENIGCVKDIADTTLPYSTDKQLVKENVSFCYVFKERDDGVVEKGAKKPPAKGKANGSTKSASRGSRREMPAVDGSGNDGGKTSASTTPRNGNGTVDAEAKKLNTSGKSKRGSTAVPGLKKVSASSRSGGKKSARSQRVVKQERDDGTVHAFSEEEKSGIVDHINAMLHEDPLFTAVNPDDDEIFKRIADGWLLCRIVNGVKEDTVPRQKMTVKKKLNKFQINEMVDAGLNGCRQLNIQVVNIGAEDIVSGTAHLVLGLLWQLVRLDLLNNVTRNKERLRQFAAEGVDIDSMVPEDILLMWVNYHLKQAGCARQISNFSSDIKDSEVYTRLLHQLRPKVFALSPLDKMDRLERANALLQEAAKEDVDKFINGKDIVEGNGRLNFAFVANLFNHFQSDEAPEPESESEEEPDEEELGAWREDLSKLAETLRDKSREADDAEERLARLKAQRDALRDKHAAEVEALKAELEKMAASEPQSEAELALLEEIDEAEKEKLAAMSKQTDLLRKAADAADELDDNEQDMLLLNKRKQAAEIDIREFKRNHKFEMGALRRKLMEAKREEALLEQELRLQEEELRKTNDEKQVLNKRLKQLGVELEVTTIDRIQEMSAKDKLDRQLFHAKRYLVEAKTDKKVKEKKKKTLVTTVRKAKEELDEIDRERQQIIAETRLLKEETKMINEEIVDADKQNVRARNIRMELEDTVRNLKAQLEEDVDFHLEMRDKTVQKHQETAAIVAKSVVKDLARKSAQAELLAEEAAELEEELDSVKVEARQTAKAAEQARLEAKALAKEVDKADEERAQIEKKRRKLEKQLRKAKRMIQDQSKNTKAVVKEADMVAKKAAEEEARLEQARREAEKAELDRQALVVEVELVKDAAEQAEIEKKKAAEAAMLLAMEEMELEKEREEQEAEKRAMLDRVEREYKEEKERAEKTMQAELRKLEREREEAREKAAAAAAAAEEERLKRVRLEEEAQRARDQAAAAEREVRATAVAAAMDKEEYQEQRSELRDVKEEKKRQKETAEALEKAATEAEERQRELDMELARLAADRERIEEEAEQARLAAEEKRRQLLNDMKLADEEIESAREEAVRTKKKLREQQKKKAQEKAEELERKARLEAKRIKVTGEKEVTKLKNRNKTLEERMAELDAEIEAEKTARLKHEAELAGA